MEAKHSSEQVINLEYILDKNKYRSSVDVRSSVLFIADLNVQISILIQI